MIRIRQIKIDVIDDNKEVLKKEIEKILKIKIENFNIVKQSIDARDKDKIYYVYEVDIPIDESILNKKYLKHNPNILKSPNMNYEYKIEGCKYLENRPIIVGMGPCGLFLSYLLALNNFKPIIIDRGESVYEREKTVNNFWNNNELNLESNVLFGEGGAGTFSDGKLNTLIKDKENRGHFILETFVKFGANKEILYSYKPHIGTDVLKNVVKNMREEIIKLGGTFLYNSKLEDINIVDNNIKSVIINQKEYPCNLLVLAIGHSARDTFNMLYNKGLEIESKPFAVGIRIEHPQKMIDLSQYGEKYYEYLKKASYKLTYNSSFKRGVYSFCMCPGGYVVNSSSEKNRLSINGMSYNDRNSENANSAIIVTITKKDFGNHPLDGIKYQRELEEKAYKLGKGNIPIQLLKDFYLNRETTELKDVKPLFKGNYTLSNLNNLFNEEITNSLKEAFFNFDKKIKGFKRDDAIIAAVESRTSSPVKIIRDENLEASIKGIYPSGEGAGYAGGITSAAIDGLRVFEAIIKKYKGLNNNKNII